MIKFSDRSYLTIGKGVVIDLENPNPKAITPEIVAHSLFHQNRYAGHLSFGYPVLNHTFIVCATIMAILEPSYNAYKVAVIGLTHDDTEAIVSDIPHPVKMILPEFSELEKHLWDKAIAPAWGLDSEDINNRLVNIVDKACWDLEECVVHFGDSKYAMNINTDADLKDSPIQHHVINWIDYIIRRFRQEELDSMGVKLQDGVDSIKSVNFICRQLLWGQNLYAETYNEQIQRRVWLQNLLFDRMEESYIQD
jgi:hypothetical protein